MLRLATECPAVRQGSANALPAWVVFRQLGEPSQVWITRQLEQFRRIRPRAICWEIDDRQPAPAGVTVTRLPFEAMPAHGRRRWLHRLANLPQGNFYGTIGIEAQHLSELAGEHRPSVILCHFGHTALRLLPVARRRRIPLVAHFHGLDVSSGLGNRWYRWSLLRWLREFTAIVVVNEDQRQWMLDHGAREDRVHVIPCGVPIDRFTLASGLGAGVGACRFVSVARFVEVKAPLSTIRAFAACVAAGLEARLTMIGDGPLLPEARRLATALGVGDRIEFPGVLPTDQVVRAMQASDVFVQHSVTTPRGDREGWPVALAEASACGLPVVSTRHGGMRSQVIEGVTGLLVDEYDVDAMATCMLQLARDPALRRQMGFAGRKRMEGFDTAVQVSKLEDVLLSAAKA